MTLAQLIAQSAQQLEAANVAFGHGTTNAHDEAAWLVLWALGLPLDTDVDAHHDLLSALQQERAQDLVAQRISSRQPAAYLTREAWLQGVSFYVDARCIVPRSLIAEVLAQGLLDAWLVTDKPHVLDLCTGNGSLAVLAALAWPQARVEGLDISSDALAVAAINGARHDVSARVQWHVSDGLAQAHGLYDLILCNPPYVNSSSMDALPAEFRAEPPVSLAGGVDGMDFIRPLLRDVSLFLAPDGVMVLEIGHERDHFEAAFPGLEPLWLSTSAGDDAVLLLTRDMLQAWSRP